MRYSSLHSATMVSTLRQLASLITDSVDTLESVYLARGVALPSDITLPTTGPGDNDAAQAALRQDPGVIAAVSTIMAAAAQLSAQVCDPVITARNAAQSFYVSACLNVAQELNVAEVLREAGPEGLDAQEIATKCKVDAGVLARILRLLATHHIFCEHRPNVFANNAISAVLDKRKSSDDLFKKSSLFFRSATELTASLRSADGVPSARLSFNRAFNTTLPFFEWLHQPQNSAALARFGLAVKGIGENTLDNELHAGFQWGDLLPNSLIVDVGSGRGNTSLRIAKRYPQLRFVNQDLKSQIRDAERYWHQQLPQHVEQGLVRFQVHNFFDPQPIRDADVFLLRLVAHNWPDRELEKILRRLRDAAKPTGTGETRLVMVDKIVSSAARSTPSLPAGDASGKALAPLPLLPNWGIVNAHTYYVDMTMFMLLDGVERTLPAFEAVLNRGGWKLERVYHMAGVEESHIVAVIADSE
ncbi:Methyltransf-2 domain-containing protein [Mycena chlorophos]|uniref:Methyltransf-2 domain-containing protein n=1 Tax=Mycena chlorophos TaxID=658473 RepID=A0A8H6SSN5_MYCCL|nr:Methyltransf-2 domain-containing protein [Mycena chlorophos]